MTRILAAFFLLSLTGAVPALAQDSDGDGVPDANDNCVDHANASQLDTNHDGYGNRCDPDYYNDGLVDDIDYELFAECFGGSTNPHCDLDGDGITGVSDFSIFSAFYGGAPGPSGLACAGSIPCSDPSVVGDTDGDGVGDDIDNCVDHSNATQLDTNADGFGNRCDPDYDNDGIVDDVDYEIFSVCFGTADPDCDLDGNGITGVSDFSIFSAFYGGAPGPAGPGAQDSCPCSIDEGNCP